VYHLNIFTLLDVQYIKLKKHVMHVATGAIYHLHAIQLVLKMKYVLYTKQIVIVQLSQQLYSFVADVHCFVVVYFVLCVFYYILPPKNTKINFQTAKLFCLCLVVENSRQIMWNCNIVHGSDKKFIF
jgi:hypothetical protein